MIRHEEKKDSIYGQNRRDRTGIPALMRERFEKNAGVSLADVRVHYNSSKPAGLQSYAYTQGNQVYIGPGQERHLPHELGHVVQQKRGQVKPTMRVGSTYINDSEGMEREADAIAESSLVVQRFEYGKFIRSYWNGAKSFVTNIPTAIRSLRNGGEERSDMLNPARWRLNPVNIAAGFMNAIEESRDNSNYHTSSRHGAHNTLTNARGRLNNPTTMQNHYTNTPVRRSATQGRFNSEAWERYSWNYAKRLFEQDMRALGFSVEWVANNPGRTGNNTWNILEHHNTVRFGSAVGVSMSARNPAVPVNNVKVAVNYIVPPLRKVQAWNGQMFPVAGMNVMQGHVRPGDPVGANNGAQIQVPYSLFF